PFNTNRKEEEKDIIAQLETAAQTAQTYLFQCGNIVAEHDNEDEFTTDVLYTLLNRSLCASKPLPDRIREVLDRYVAENRESEADHILMNEFIAPESIDFRHANYIFINGVYHSYLRVPSDGYINLVYP